MRPCTTGCGGDIDKILAIPLGRLVWWLFRQADVFIAQTPELAQELRQYGVRAERIRVFPNQVNIDWSKRPDNRRRRQARELLGLPHKPTVLFVGRLVPRKNLRLVLEAWKTISRRHNAPDSVNRP